MDWKSPCTVIRCEGRVIAKTLEEDEESAAVWWSFCADHYLKPTDGTLVVMRPPP